MKWRSKKNEEKKFSFSEMKFKWQDLRWQQQPNRFTIFTRAQNPFRLQPSTHFGESFGKIPDRD